MQRRGFTLIELIMAIVIGGIVVLPLMMMFVNASLKNPKLESVNLALNLAVGKMEAVTGKSFAYISSEAVTAIGGNYSDYNSQVIVHYVTSTDVQTSVDPTITSYKSVQVSITSSNFTGSIDLFGLATDVSNP
jgi:prepilin-type N-terminal cleavage/methylation domain-containing protein